MDLAQDMAQRFLDHLARQNTSEEATFGLDLDDGNAAGDEALMIDDYDDGWMDGWKMCD